MTHGALHRLAGPGVFVQRLAVLLQRGMHGRHLIDVAGMRDQCLTQRRLAHRHFAGLQHLAFRIAGGGADAETDFGNVFLVGVQHEAGKARGFAEADRQKTGSQRIERAGMAGLRRLEQAARLLQRVV